MPAGQLIESMLSERCLKHAAGQLLRWLLAVAEVGHGVHDRSALLLPEGDPLANRVRRAATSTQRWLYSGPTALEEDLGSERRVEALEVEALVAQLAAERPALAVLPRTSGLDEQSRQDNPAQSATHRLGRELMAVVGADVLWRRDRARSHRSPYSGIRQHRRRAARHGLRGAGAAASGRSRTTVTARRASPGR